jgi:hypothetical protein
VKEIEPSFFFLPNKLPTLLAPQLAIFAALQLTYVRVHQALKSMYLKGANL